MDKNSIYCSKCSGAPICKTDISFNSNLCTEFKSGIRNDEEKKILEFMKNYVPGKENLFIHSIKQLKDEREKRMTLELKSLLGPIFKDLG